MSLPMKWFLGLAGALLLCAGIALLVYALQPAASELLRLPLDAALFTPPQAVP